MKIINVVLLTAACCQLSIAGTPDIETNLGKTFVISLPENATTGYIWHWQVTDGADKRMVELIKKEFVSKDPSMVGSGGTAHFTFKAMHVGPATILLNLKRGWEKNSDIETKRYDLQIRPAKHKKMRTIKARAGFLTEIYNLVNIYENVFRLLFKT